jgi:hypothetical protein
MHAVVIKIVSNVERRKENQMTGVSFKMYRRRRDKMQVKYTCDGWLARRGMQ